MARGVFDGQTTLSKLVVAYVVLTYAGTWACWGLSALLLYAVVPALGGLEAGGLSGLLHACSGALRLLGTLCPAHAAYALLPLVRSCGLAGVGAGRAETDLPDKRAGFWAFAFGARASLGGWLLFAALVVWRWVMFHSALGFPETPTAALTSFATSLPALLLGGGFEEIGWRGVLQPALVRLLLGGTHDGSGRRVVAEVIAPLFVGVIWACWHLPLFAMPDAYQHGIPFLPFVGIAVALSYSLGALRALTGGSLACVLAHAWYNAMLVAPLVPNAAFGALLAVEALACAAVLVWRTVRGPSARQC